LNCTSGADHSIGYKTTNSTALFLAAQNGHLEVVRELVKAGARVDSARVDIGAVPLTVSAERGHIEVVRCLIEAGANVNHARSNDGTTPLIWAAIKVCRFLFLHWT